MAAMGTFGFNFQTIFPLINEYVMNGGSTGLSLLLVLTGIGSVIAGTVRGVRGQAERAQAARLGGGVHRAPVPSRSVALAGGDGGLSFFIGVASIIFMTSANTRLQLVVTGEMRGPGHGHVRPPVHGYHSHR